MCSARKWSGSWRGSERGEPWRAEPRQRPDPVALRRAEPRQRPDALHHAGGYFLAGDLFHSEMRSRIGSFSKWQVADPATHPAADAARLAKGSPIRDRDADASPFANSCLARIYFLGDFGLTWPKGIVAFDGSRPLADVVGYRLSAFGQKRNGDPLIP